MPAHDASIIYVGANLPTAALGSASGAGGRAAALARAAQGLGLAANLLGAADSLAGAAANLAPRSSSPPPPAYSGPATKTSEEIFGPIEEAPAPAFNSECDRFESELDRQNAILASADATRRVGTLKNDLLNRNSQFLVFASQTQGEDEGEIRRQICAIERNEMLPLFKERVRLVEGAPSGCSPHLADRVQRTLAGSMEAVSDIDARCPPIQPRVAAAWPTESGRRANPRDGRGPIHVDDNCLTVGKSIVQPLSPPCPGGGHESFTLIRPSGKPGCPKHPSFTYRDPETGKLEKISHSPFTVQVCGGAPLDVHATGE